MMRPHDPDFLVAQSSAKAASGAVASRLGWGMAGLLVAAHGAAVGLQLADAFHAHVVFVLIEGLIYAGAAWMITTGRMNLSTGAILAIAALLRITVLGLAPYHSSDIFRYIWDGRVQGAGINPYLYIPNDAALSALRDSAIWPNINRADYAHTIYPPAAEALYFLATRVSQTIVWMKTVLVLFEAGAIAVLLRLLDGENLPRQRILLYAWSPLPVWEFAGSGHVDAAMMAFAVAAVLLRRRGADVAAGAALGLAVLVKFFPLVLLPALWRRWEWRLPVACAAIIALFYLLYSGAGWKVLGFLPNYVGEEGIGDAHGFWLVSRHRAHDRIRRSRRRLFRCRGRRDDRRGAHDPGRSDRSRQNLSPTASRWRPPPCSRWRPSIPGISAGWCRSCASCRRRRSSG